jgi:hypothetical protein
VIQLHTGTIKFGGFSPYDPFPGSGKVLKLEVMPDDSPVAAVFH